MIQSYALTMENCGGLVSSCLRNDVISDKNHSFVSVPPYQLPTYTCYLPVTATARVRKSVIFPFEHLLGKAHLTTDTQTRSNFIPPEA